MNKTVVPVVRVVEFDHRIISNFVEFISTTEKLQKIEI